MSSDFGSDFDGMSDREIAVELDITEDEARDRRRETGFLNLEEFVDDQGPEDRKQVDLELGEMERRKLQGFMGEKVADLMMNRVLDHIGDHLKDSWVLRDKLHLINADSKFQRYWASGRPRQGEIRIEGRNLKHSGNTEEELEDHVRERCAVADGEIFKKFREVRNPFIDFSFYAVKKDGREEVEFNVEDYSSNRFENSQKLREEIPRIKDFKIVMIEVKTTKDNAENLFSTNQRKAKNMAQKSPFLEFFSLKVDKEFQELGIPEKFDGEIKKHS